MYTPDTPEFEVYRKFHGRCVHCGRPGKDIHEYLESRGSGGKDALREENRALLCVNCHEWAHAVGIRVSGPLIKRDIDFTLSVYAGNV